MDTLTKFYLMLKNRAGATMAEYGVIAAVVILVAIGAFVLLGGWISDNVTGLTEGL